MRGGGSRSADLPDTRLGAHWRDANFAKRMRSPSAGPLRKEDAMLRPTSALASSSSSGRKEPTEFFAAAGGRSQPSSSQQREEGANRVLRQCLPRSSQRVSRPSLRHPHLAPRPPPPPPRPVRRRKQAWSWQPGFSRLYDGQRSSPVATRQRQLAARRLPCLSLRRPTWHWGSRPAQVSYMALCNGWLHIPGTLSGSLRAGEAVETLRVAVRGMCALQ